MPIFSERDEAFIYIAVWCIHLGGHWCGYVGYLNPTRRFPPGSLHLHVDVNGGISADQIPGLDPNIELPGFDCIHAGDSNIGPDGETGVTMSFGRQPDVWTRDRVFKHLKKAVASLK
jgi:hypothetical protein